MAVTASFFPGLDFLTVVGDGLANTITMSRDAGGNILVNSGGVTVVGGTPTIANIRVIQVFGQAGNDTLTIDEANGALPASLQFGGKGDDTMTGGSGGDQLFGESGNDVLLGKGGLDLLLGGDGNDALTGGDGNDQLFGEAGGDRLIWNPGDDSDLFEGGDGLDTTEVNGGNGAETFLISANGARVRFDRVTPAPFSLDIGTTERLVLNANGGNDTISTSGNLAALIRLTIDGGAGEDTISGGVGADVLRGGDGNDVLAGGQGQDRLTGGLNLDTFDFNLITESGKKTPDIIKDLVRGEDLIDLASIDAIAGGADDPFTFIGKDAFHSIGGELHYLRRSGYVLVEGDVDGNGKADFRIKVDDIAKLDGADFLP